MKLGRLKEWRESSGLTQRELASKAGIGHMSVVRAETGVSVRPGTARKLADALGREVPDLLEHPPTPAELVVGSEFAGKGLAPNLPTPAEETALGEERRANEPVERERVADLLEIEPPELDEESAKKYWREMSEAIKAVQNQWALRRLEERRAAIDDPDQALRRVEQGPSGEDPPAANAQNVRGA